MLLPKVAASTRPDQLVKVYHDYFGLSSDLSYTPKTERFRGGNPEQIEVPGLRYRHFLCIRWRKFFRHKGFTVKLSSMVRVLTSACACPLHPRDMHVSCS